MTTKNTIGCFIILGGAAMVAATSITVPSKALRGGVEAKANMQPNNDEVNRKRPWRSWLSRKDATDGSTNSGSSEYEYAGCFEAQFETPFDYVVADDAMSLEICEAICSDRSALFYGLLKGDSCSCGSDTTLLEFDDGQTEGVCGEACAGDSSEVCGGLTAYDIFLREGVVLSSDIADDPVYVGCYEVEASDPFYKLTTDEDMTVEVCSSYCASDDALYFGLLQGIMCGCGNTEGFLSSQQEVGTCDVVCGGDASETCGGILAYDLYQLEGIAINPSDSDADDGTVCTDGTVGIQTDDSCCVAECGECGGVGCSTRVVGLGASDCCSTEIADSGELCSETGAAPCVVDATEESDDDVSAGPYGDYIDYEYIGCYESTDTFGFEHRVTEAEMTHEFCFRKCALDFAMYMAIIEGDVCKCGTDADFLTADKEEGSCDIACPGDTSTTCGGSDSYEMFLLIQVSEATEVSDADVPTVSDDDNVPDDDGTTDDDGSDTPDVSDDDSGAVDDGTTDSSIETNGDHAPVGPYGDYIDYEYVGCFMATNTFGFRHRVTELSMTHEFCFRKCALNFAMYMAITEGNVCKCGVDEDFVDADKEAGTCDVECPGDTSTTCGDYNGSYELFTLVISS